MNKSYLPEWENSCAWKWSIGTGRPAKPNLSKPAEGHKIYLSLLSGVAIEEANQVWSTDITYTPMANGFLYLCAIIDWYTRFVLS